MSRTKMTKASADFIARYGICVVLKNNMEIYLLRVKSIEKNTSKLLCTVKSTKGYSEILELSFTELDKLKYLTECDLGLEPGDINIFIGYLSRLYNKTTLVYHYSELGWKYLSSGLVYLGAELITTTGQAEIVESDNIIEPNEKPNFIVALKQLNDNKTLNINNYNLSDSQSHLTSKGSLHEAIEFLNNLIASKILPQIVIATGLSAVLIGLLRHNTLLVNLCGNSSLGKSIYSKLVQSLFTNPDTRRLFLDFDSTTMSLQCQLGGIDGVPIIVDDHQNDQRKQNSLDKIAYLFTKGTGSSRLNKQYEVEEKIEWFTSILTSSEISMAESSKTKNLGILRRTVEISINQGELTEDANEATAIKKFITNNYGTVGTSFVKKLVENGYTKKVMEKIFNEEVAEFQALVGKSGVANGFVESTSHITLAAKLAQKLLGINFDLDNMYATLIKSGCNLAEKFGAQSLMINSTFEEVYKNLISASEKYDCYTTYDSYTNMIPADFNDFCNSYNINNRDFKRYLIAHGYLRADKNSTDKSIKVNGKSKKFISFLSNVTSVVK